MPVVTTVLSDDYVSVPEAAKTLHVSPSTIWRWIDRGRLPAYRVGQRRIRLKKSDVEGCIMPVTPTRPPRFMERLHVLRRGELPPPTTVEEVERGLAALEEPARLGREIFGDQREQRESYEYINELRDERTRQLMER